MEARSVSHSAPVVHDENRQSETMGIVNISFVIGPAVVPDSVRRYSQQTVSSSTSRPRGVLFQSDPTNRLKKILTDLAVDKQLLQNAVKKGIEAFAPMNAVNRIVGRCD